MRYKFIIISFLLVLLAFTVYQMLQYEQTIREERVVREYVYDDSGPLIDPVDAGVLEERARKADYYFRVEGDGFSRLNTLSSPEEKDWEPVFYKGVNLGVALPGKFPGQFSMSYDQYLEWLRMIGDMNANVIRLYTILPPEFYSAFSHYNLMHHDQPLYLLQGVWATVPKDKDYFNEEYSRSLKKEIIDVIDVLHGNAVIEPKAGKASGAYSYDVSKYVAGIIFGREWEPDAVHHSLNAHDLNQYRGAFVSVHRGNAMEVWIGEMLDFIARYETQTYGMQHPLSFVNWLPLDPMYHNTEIIENEKVREYDNDLERLDFNHFHHSPRFIPGIFASYHAYPYYPDFIYLDSNYRSPIVKGESDHFKLYLEDLKNHHRGMPLIISEYGVPSSRGNSHITPAGYDQGGHSEAEQASINLKLTEDIVQSGCAGAVIFEWADEWFKHNWLVMDFEQPEHHRPRWHNLENPEQNFGILALESRTKTVDGDLSDWDPGAFQGEGIRYASAGDPGYFYLALKFDDFDFRIEDLFVALDVIGAEQGDHRLPFTDHRFDRGFEFLIEFMHRDSARILVDEPFSIYTDIYKDSIPAYASKPNANGRFVEQLLLSNRKRESLLGQTFDSVLFNRSPLIHGKSSLPEHSNADWYWNDSTGVLELRLTWHLLNVTDPSRHYVLDNRSETAGMDYSPVEEFHALFFRRNDSTGALVRYPENTYAAMSWTSWDMPDYQSRLKPAYDSLRLYFDELAAPEASGGKQGSGEESFEIRSYPDAYEGAVSLSFDQGLYSQFSVASPVLDKYFTRATFGIVPTFLDESPGQYRSDDLGRLKRLSLRELRFLIDKDHGLALQDWEGSEKSGALAILEKAAGKEVSILHKVNAVRDLSDGELFRFTRYLDPDGRGILSSNGQTYRSFYAHLLSMSEWAGVLRSKASSWIILVYRHFYFEDERNGRLGPGIGTARIQFDRQVRLARNEGFWIAPEFQIFKYLKEVASSEVEVNTYGKTIFFNIKNDLDAKVFDQPLTVRFRTDASFIELSGSVHDGIYSNRTGWIYFDAVPGQEVTIDLLGA